MYHIPDPSESPNDGHRVFPSLLLDLSHILRDRYCTVQGRTKRYHCIRMALTRCILKFYLNFRKAKVTQVILQLHFRLISSPHVPFQSISTSIEQQLSLKCQNLKILVDTNQSSPYTRTFRNRSRIVWFSFVFKDFQWLL